MQGSGELGGGGCGAVRRREKGEARLQGHPIYKWPLSVQAQTSHLHTHSLPPSQRSASHSLGPLGIYRKGHQETKVRAGHSQSWILNTTVRKSDFISGPASVNWVPQKNLCQSNFLFQMRSKKYICRKKMLNAFRLLFP